MKTVINTKRVMPNGNVVYFMSRQRFGKEYRIMVATYPFQERHEIAWALRKARREMQYALDHIQ